MGRAVARNNLVKTALFGNDPNWGRVLAAVGTTAAAFEPDELDVAVNGVWVCRAGAAGRGPGQGRPDRPATSRSRSTCTPAPTTATIWTNDLSHAYVARELGVLDMSLAATCTPGRRPRPTR